MRLAATILVASLALASGPALWSAPRELPGKADASRIAAGTYLSDSAHTLVGWRVSHMGFNDYFGLFGEIKGTLVLDPAKPEVAKVTVKVPLGKILTTSSALNSELLRSAPPRGKAGGQGGKPRYFGPNPGDALFTSTAVKPGADGTSAMIEGNLTLNGRTRPVTIAARFSGAGKNPYTGKQTVGFHGTAQIVRSEFGLDSDLGLVADKVDLEIAAAFELQKP